MTASTRRVCTWIAPAFATAAVTMAALLPAVQAGPAAPSQAASLTVHVDRPGIRISPTLYGLFFEEINHAGDGGLYAEKVRNRAFEDASTPTGWSLVREGTLGAAMTLDTAQPLNERTPHSLRLEIAATSNELRGRAGVANDGYWGIPVEEGKRYRLSFWARSSEGFRGPLGVTLEGNGGSPDAAGRITGLTPQWKRFECGLTAKAADPAARLVIAASAPGTVWLDVVSLSPEGTWKGRPNGLRADLVGMLAQMKPAFLRFPGGCFCEGDRLANAFRWKDSIGPIEQRPGHWNLWGYRSTDGLGFHEYLQLCEDLGAEPLFVINCGMSHTDRVPLDRLDPWVQDALDAIEYANGPAASRWGALRVKHGHPRPFGLKYLEIGNENGWGNTLSAYEERYARFYDAIRARYPEVRLLANVPIRNRPMDIVDDHYYNSPEWFLANAGRYDRADRKGPKIYVGEYAVTRNCGQGNLRAALAEAAFMMGLERNSDVVTMASYAPLFVNVHDRKWNPDAIPFDGTSSYGTPSYHVQKLFSVHRPDVLLASELDVAQPATAPSGSIGLATWNTQAEFRDLTVTRDGRTLLAADFSANAPGWRPLRGEWKVGDGAYRQTGPGTDLRSVAGDPEWTDYTLHLKARKLGGAEGFLVMFRVRDSENWYWWNIGGWNNTQHAIERSLGGGKSLVGEPVRGRIETGRLYDIRIELQGRRIRCFLDGQLIHDVEDREPSPVAAIAGRKEGTGEIIVKAVNTTGQPRPTTIRLEGVRDIPPEGSATVLSGAHPEDENSLSQPHRIAPVTLPLRNVGRWFSYTLQPYSLTILRVREK